jgi:hypothetical protein
LQRKIAETRHSGWAKKDRITHRIELKTPSQIDDEAKTWLKIPYEPDKSA